MGWRSVLKKWGLSSFHMKEFAHCTGEFARFKNDEDGRRELLRSLAALIFLHCHYGCAASVINEDYRKLNADPRIGSAYSLATKGCIALADGWIRTVKRDGPLTLILEYGCKYSKELLEHLGLRPPEKVLYIKSRRKSSHVSPHDASIRTSFSVSIRGIRVSGCCGGDLGHSSASCEYCQLVSC
jgi:hypothetical protein